MGGRARNGLVLVALAATTVAALVFGLSRSHGGRRLAVAVDRLPPSPLVAREDAAGVWTGDEIVVWGGHGAGRVFADGASYNPSTRAWRTLPPAPLSARTRHVAVWSGHEMFVWGGTTTGTGVGGLLDGAAYDPKARTWRTIAPAPPGTDRTYATGVWANGKLVIAGGQSATGENDGSLLVYDAPRDSWRTVAVPVVAQPSVVDEEGNDIPNIVQRVVALAARGPYV